MEEKKDATIVTSNAPTSEVDGPQLDYKFPREVCFSFSYSFETTLFTDFKYMTLHHPVPFPIHLPP